MKKIENGCQDKLDWFDGKHINEILFCQEFLKTHPMRCIGGTLADLAARTAAGRDGNHRSRTTAPER